jgi:iron(III) transport system ATP-binding protein
MPTEDGGSIIVGEEQKLGGAAAAAGGGDRGDVLLRVADLRKTYRSTREAKAAGVQAADGVSFEIETGTLFTLLGPSGCGKTTTLRCVAGLEEPDSGEIWLGDRALYSSKERKSVPVNRRGLGMVFQSYAIWPHMTVRQNVGYPLTLPGKRRPKAEVKDRVDRVLGVMQLDAYGERKATELSGGQQQRLALARALVVEPRLLLLDEPLSNLDAKLRESMRFELKRVQQELGITSVYVTHDQAEALAISNRIAVMNRGKVEQIGTPQEIYERPQTGFVADFIGTSNFFTGTVEETLGDGRYLVRTDYGPLVVRSESELSSGSRWTVSVRPEEIEVRRDAGGGQAPGAWRGRVGPCAYLGEMVDHVVEVGDVEIRVRTHPRQAAQQGDDVALVFDERRCVLLPLEPAQEEG